MKSWIYTPSKIHTPIPEGIKKKTLKSIDDYITNTLKPQYPTTFNPESKARQCVGFYAKWRKAYVYLGRHIHDTRTNVISTEYEEPCIRLTYSKANLFIPAYLRHTGTYQEISFGEALPLQECLQMLEIYWQTMV